MFKRFFFFSGGSENFIFNIFRESHNLHRTHSGGFCYYPVLSFILPSLGVLRAILQALEGRDRQAFIMVHFFFFSLPDVPCDPTDLIWRKRTPFEAMTGRTAPSLDGLLAEVFRVFLSRKANVWRSVHSPRDHFIITHIISDRRDWCDSRGKLPLARNLNRNFFGRSQWLHGQEAKLSFRILSFILPPCRVAILPTFGGKESHLRRWLVAQPSSHGFLAEVFRGFLQ